MKKETYLENTIEIKNDFVDRFRQEVLSGLLSEPKQMDSKYFYDEAGDVLFQQIMELPEYYPTRCEMQIFKEQSSAIGDVLVGNGDEFEVIELGAGDATKSIHLLNNLINRNADFTYMPIDISEHMIDYLTENLPVLLPKIRIQGFAGEYFTMLEKVSDVSDKRKVLLFLGSNIGNMDVETATEFCSEMRKYLNPGDMVLMGMDLKKNPRTILAAYDDAAGITKKFNLNLLTRINSELDGNFDLKKFEHYAMYDPETGACKSYLISLEEHQVLIGATKIDFAKDEFIYMEISQKFTIEQARSLANQTGFKQLANFQDDKKWFLDAVWVAE